MGQKDIGQNPEEKEETNKDSSTTELNQRQFQQGHSTAAHQGNPLTQGRESERVD